MADWKGRESFFSATFTFVSVFSAELQEIREIHILIIQTENCDTNVRKQPDEETCRIPGIECRVGDEQSKTI